MTSLTVGSVGVTGCGSLRPVASHSAMTLAYSWRLAAVPYLPSSTTSSGCRTCQ